MGRLLGLGGAAQQEREQAESGGGDRKVLHGGEQTGMDGQYSGPNDRYASAEIRGDEEGRNHLGPPIRGRQPVDLRHRAQEGEPLATSSEHGSGEQECERGCRTGGDETGQSEDE